MKFKFIYVLLLIFSLFSCKNENEKRQAESIKDIKKKELIFSNIEKNWVFNAKPINSAAQSKTVSWKEWRAFLTELEQKPKKTIGAFQKKAAELSKKVMALNEFLPTEFNNPQMKSRISILITKVRMLDLYIHLKDIPDQKVVALIPEINTQLVALQNQMDKIVQKSNIPLEEGESELLKMIKDTARAIPNTPQLDPNTPRVE
jgi:phosphoenolpyruvate synthase/pyruvate phosphate dikinase